MSDHPETKQLSQDSHFSAESLPTSGITPTQNDTQESDLNQGPPLYAQIAIPPLPFELTYSVPTEMSSTLSLGSKVEVPLGKRKAQGFIIGFSEKLPANVTWSTKPITRRLSDTASFNAGLLEFFRWIATYYSEPISSVIDTAIPAETARKIKLLYDVVPDKIDDALNALKGKKQRLILSFLKDQPSTWSYEDLIRKFPGASATFKTLTKFGVLRSHKTTIIPAKQQLQTPDWAKGSVELNDEQLSALNQINQKIDSREFSPFLLHGITGSGKTEVYIEATKHCLTKGLSVLVVAPEIALTPQLIDRYQARCETSIAVLHSGLDRKVRWEGWRDLIGGDVSIAIGARSAIFAPLSNIGLIIIDEEHDASFKQEEGIRYNARDLAVARAKLSGCPVILGSATPSLESLLNAHRRRYNYLPLNSRHGTSRMPNIEIVDLNALKPWNMPSSNISPVLAERLSETLIKGEQAFILYNRRGFASYLQCAECAHVIQCPRCSVSLTLHKRLNLILCHMCGHSQVIPSRCSRSSMETVDGALQQKVCEGEFKQRGAGTERVFEELIKLYPTAKIARLDRDSVSSEKEYREVLDRLRKQEIQVLVGTQMIAKGHDIPNVTLVGVVDCDIGLHFPDFRAAERTYQLLTQVAGRAGRGEKSGFVVLQTRLPDHPSLTTTKNNDFMGFAKGELNLRRSLSYPPFRRLLRIVASSEESDQALHSLVEIKKEIPLDRFNVQILGPVAAPLAKVKDRWRHHLLIKAESAKELQSVLRLAKDAASKRKHVRVIFDLDPQDML